MADELETLETYKVQLRQVDAALIGEPDNEELKKLKIDLEEVIALTEELVQPAKPAAAAGETPSSSSNSAGGEATAAAGASGGETSSASLPAKDPKKWKVGDRCMAVWSKNGKHHEAVIDGIFDDKATVSFVGYKEKGINLLTDLRVAGESQKKNFVYNNSKEKKAEWAAEKERRKKRQQKKAQRFKDIEEQKEKEKKSWKDFNHKAVHKSFKGVKKASIFASSETKGGKIGVGTCGIPGRTMTSQPPADRLLVRRTANPSIR